ncbi:hypothetical protein [Yoonia maritima]|nr:hypothetical protein [Yoonia maritima]
MPALPDLRAIVTPWGAGALYCCDNGTPAGFTFGILPAKVTRNRFNAGD